MSSSLHEISDTDSDVTVDLSPNSPPKAAASTSSSSPQKHESRKKPGRNSTSPPKQSSLQKSFTLHEISDSDTDSEAEKGVTKNRSPLRHTPPKKESTSTPGAVKLQKKRKLSNEERSATKEKSSEKDARPECPYGEKCYRKNPSHFAEFCHSRETDDLESGSIKRRRREDSKPSTSRATSLPHASSVSRDASSILHAAQPLGFLLTKVTGIADRFNAFHSIHIKDILSSKMGKLQQSAQFNYKIDIPWLVAQYCVEARTKPLLVVHGASRGEKAELDMEASAFDHVRLGQARLEMMYGTHHTKMMLLLYDEGLRVVIHTANLIHQDWFQKTQGVWVSPLFPKMESEGAGDSPTQFKRDMLEYLSAYKMRALDDWIRHIRQHDLSSARVHLVASVPGRHIGGKKDAYGHLKLRKVLGQHGPLASLVDKWPVVGQFSSVGSLGGNKDLWLCKEWLETMSTVAKGNTLAFKKGNPKLQLIFPSKENVRQSLEGYAAGGSLPYSINVAKKQPYLHTFFHQWKAELRGRSVASPHIKTYLRPSPDYKQLAWFLVTSANLSKAAWGALEKNGSQLMIRSYELGVLFLPRDLSDKDTFKMLQNDNQGLKTQDGKLVFPVPYDMPPTPYTDRDRPWIWDIPYVDKPDTHGTKWCPP